MIKIALDAGHGLHTPGKRSPDDEREWSFNNAVLIACAERLSTYDGVQIRRLDDPTGKTDVSLHARTNKANAWGADALVSIHHNALKAVWHTGGGVETYVQAGTASAASKALAQAIHTRIVPAMGLRDRGVKAANFHMTRESRMPAVLTEGGFMDSRTDIKAMRDPARLKAQGYAIADGIAAHFGLKQKAGSVNISSTIEQEVRYLQLNTRQADDMAAVFKLARDKGVFSSAQHEADVRAGKMTVDTAVYLTALIAAAGLNEGKRI
ncbi:N-acetylmuramoyl-L-alanine amidase family protein [Sporosarcina sp. ITBMC105]